MHDGETRTERSQRRSPAAVFCTSHRQLSKAVELANREVGRSSGKPMTDELDLQLRH